MGAATFYTAVTGQTAGEAFASAQLEARYEYGHRGYTGTIAEKESFKVITCPDGREPIDYARHLIDTQDPRVDSKWGPAGCIEIAPQSFLFFGWASE